MSDIQTRLGKYAENPPLGRGAGQSAIDQISTKQIDTLAY
jgi:hypothetical protein